MSRNTDPVPARKMGAIMRRTIDTIARKVVARGTT